MPVLPPTAASTMPSSVVGQVHDAHAAQPGGGDEAGQVGGRPPADRHHGVVAGRADLAEHVPQVRRDLQVLALLAVGHLDRVRGEALRGEVLADRVGRRPERSGVHDGDPVGAGQRAGQLAEQPLPHHHVVRPLAPRR